MKFKALFFGLILVLCAEQIVGQNTIETLNKEKLTIGDRLEIQSDVLEEARVLNIYLPNGYAKNNSKKYPVIYLLDGSIDEDFIHISGLVQFGSFSWINILPESIVVGIANIDRKRDFTYPTTVRKDKKDYPTTGGSEKFISFIKTELQPFIETTYNVNNSKTIIGQSLGGLLATEILFKEPDLFDNYLIISPSLWWDDESLLKTNPKVYTANKAVYIAVGTEGKVMERVAKELYEKLNVIKKDNTKLVFEFFEKQTHGDALHLSVYDAFEQLFMKK